MFGKIPVLIAQEVKDDTQYNLYRELPYTRHALQSEENYVNLDEIAKYLRTWLHRTSIEAVQGNVQSLISGLQHIKIIYDKITIALNKIQEFMPRSMIRFYVKIDDLQKQLAVNKVNYNYNNTAILAINEMEIYMETTREKFISFWRQRPEILLRLPIQLHTPSIELFSSEEYLPYVMGKRELPDWLDPINIGIINEVRKMEQLREQTAAHRERYYKYLMSVTRTKIGASSEIVMKIAEYIPITIVYELLTSLSPSQFLEFAGDKVITGHAISIYVS